MDLCGAPVGSAGRLLPRYPLAPPRTPDDGGVTAHTVDRKGTIRFRFARFVASISSRVYY
ncbi:hypothetical protein CEJ39_11015 [Rhodococcus pyridinivorans]|nr:hypothetical protein CEJ39_11015 [Rhodococcus pyridinivorans]